MTSEGKSSLIPRDGKIAVSRKLAEARRRGWVEVSEYAEACVAESMLEADMIVIRTRYGFTRRFISPEDKKAAATLVDVLLSEVGVQSAAVR